MVRQADRRAATRRAVLDAAHELIRQRGYEAVSVAEIAAAAGVSKGAVFYHFESKEAVLDCLVDELQGQIAQRLRAGVDRTQQPTPESVAQTLASYLVEANKPRARQAVLVDGPQVLGWQRWREIDNTHFAAATRSAVGAIAGGRMAPQSLEAATSLVLGAVMEASLELARTPPRHVAGKVKHFELTIKAMLAGLGAALE